MVSLMLNVCCYTSTKDIIAKEEENKSGKIYQITADFYFLYIFLISNFYPYIFHNENILLGFLLKGHDPKQLHSESQFHFSLLATYLS